MKKVLICSLALMSVVAVNAQKSKPATKPAPKPAMKTLIDSFSYAAGFNVANNMRSQGISTINTALMMKAINDVYGNKPPLLTEEIGNASLQKQLTVFAQAKAKAVKAASVAFLEANKKRKEVITLPNGLQYEVIKKSDSVNGLKPKMTDTVAVNYIGTLIDGTEFDQSYKRGQAYVTPMTLVIKGWSEILQLMTVGDRWKVYIPTELAYGDYGSGQAIPPGAALVFEMTLEGIKPAQK